MRKIPFATLVDLNPRDKPSGEIVPFVGMEDVSEDGHLLDIKQRHCSELSTGLTAFADNDGLFAKITPCMENGKGAIVSGLCGAVGLGSTEFYVLRAKPQAVEPRFVYHWTRARSFRRFAESMMTGSAGQRRVPARFFNRFLVPEIALPEQTRIADILDTVDERIASTKLAISKMQLIRSGVTMRLLSGPEGRSDYRWMSGKLGNFIHLQRGFDITVSEQHPGNIPVVSSSGITSFHDTPMVRSPGVVTGRKGKLGNVYYLEEDFWPHDTTLWVTDFKGNVPQFIAMLLENLHLERFDAATSVPTLNRNFLHPLPVKLPIQTEQRRIVEIASQHTATLNDLARELAKLDSLKQGLIDDLLTGQVRVGDREREG